MPEEARRRNARVLAVIPARLQSTRLPEKPLQLIHGKPMIQWVYERARLATKIAKLVVATDSPRIVEAVQAFGGEVRLTSPDHQSGTDRLVEVATEMPGFEVVLNVQGDEPLINPRTLDDLIERFLASDRSPMGTLVRRLDDLSHLGDATVVKVTRNVHGDALYFSRSPIPFNRDGQADVVYFKHIGVYIYDRSFLLAFPSLPSSALEQAERLEQLRVLEAGHRISVFETDADSLGVDTRDDLERVRRLLAN